MSDEPDREIDFIPPPLDIGSSLVEQRTRQLLFEIEERKRAERELRKSEAQLRRMLDDSPFGVAIVDPVNDRRLFVNRRYREMYGVDRDDAPFDLPIVESYADPEDRRRLRDMFEREGSVSGIEVQRKRVDSSLWWARIDWRPIRFGNCDARMVWCQDITEWRLAQDRVQEARRQADQASRAKSELLANMSHELRTPLNAILGFSGTIRERVFGPLPHVKYAEYIDNIHESGLHLLDLITDLLDLAKIEAGAVGLEEQYVELAEIAQAAVRLVLPRAESGRIRLSSRIAPELPRLFIDRRRLKQILVNLLSNAVKFSHPDGDVVVDAHFEADRSVAITVADRGIGMSETDIKVAFLPFGQVESSLSHNHEGTGLGLPLTKGLVELLGGTLALNSIAGQGTTVTVRFPASRCEAL